MEFTKDGNKIEYSATNQHNGYILEGYVLRKTSFNAQVGLIGQSFYEDGQWHTTATVPSAINLKQFATADAALAVAHADTKELGLLRVKETESMAENSLPKFSENEQNNPILASGFIPLGRDCLGGEEYGLRTNAEDGGIYAIKLSLAEKEVAVKVQYEKDSIIDTRRTVKGNFDNLDKAMNFIASYGIGHMVQNESCTAVTQKSTGFRMR